VKKILIGIGALVVLVIAAAVIVPMVVPLETYKAQIAGQVEGATGRKMTIGGDLKLSVLPRIEIATSKVALANAPGGKAKNMLELGEMRVAVGLFPLLSGNVAIDTFVLVDPIINLEVDRQGRKNWEFKTDEKKADRPAERAEPKGKDGGVGLQGIQLGDVRLVNGRLSYFDATSNTTESVDAINMKVSLPSLDQRFAADGSLTVKGEKIELKVAADKPRALVEGGETPIEARVASKHVNLSFKGTHRAAANAAATKGAVELDVPSMRALAAWLAEPLKGNPNTLNKLAIKGNLDMSGKTIAFGNATLEFDDMKGRGDIKVVQDKRPLIQAKLALDKLNLNPYMGGKQEQKAPAPAPGGAPRAGSGPSEWSDEPIDVSGLKSLDADLALEVGGIEVEKIKVGKSALVVGLKAGKLDAQLTELRLYQGNGKGRISVDASGAVPSVSNSFELSGLQAEPFMTDAMDLDRVSGTANARIETATRGRSQKEMVGGLNGKGEVKFLDGAIKGINLAAMVRNVATAFLDPKARETQKTDFAEFGGTFTITNGVLSNQDMALKSPLIRVEGRGTSDLLRRTVNYRVTPKFVASIEGQGGRDTGGVAVPVVVTGTWDNISYKPDLAGVISDVVKDPSKALEGVRGLIPGQTPGGSQPGQQQSPIPSPQDTLKKLFGR
jgi:AsmA protein